MASSKQIEAWVREVLRLSPRRVVRVRKSGKQVQITVNRKTHVLDARSLDFAQIAGALLSLGPSCAEEGAESDH